MITELVALIKFSDNSTAWRETQIDDKCTKEHYINGLAAKYKRQGRTIKSVTVASFYNSKNDPPSWLKESNVLLTD